MAVFVCPSVPSHIRQCRMHGADIRYLHHPMLGCGPHWLVRHRHLAVLGCDRQWRRLQLPSRPNITHSSQLFCFSSFITKLNCSLFDMPSERIKTTFCISDMIYCWICFPIMAIISFCIIFEARRV